MPSANSLLFGLISATVGGGAMLLHAELRLPGDNHGYAPEQPIAFSHRLHAGEIGLDCQYCHSGARRSRHAGVPSASVCMNCHGRVTDGFDRMLEERDRAEAEGREPATTVSPELQKLYDAVGFDPIKGQATGAPAGPIEWVKVHNLPDFVWFDHRPHVARGLACESCHGPVGSLDRMSQEAPLTMGWCIDCHRSQPVEPSLDPLSSDAQPTDHVSTDCVTCHL